MAVIFGFVWGGLVDRIVGWGVGRYLVVFFYQGNCLFHMGMVLGGGGGVFGGLYFSEGIVFLVLSGPAHPN